MLNKNEFIELSKVHSAYCVSIYIPTSRVGKDEINGKDMLNLKNQLKDVKNKLEENGMKLDQINSFVKPIEDLILDNKFWKYQSDGLAIFLSEGFFKYYTIPVYFKEYNYSSNNFYLKPLLFLFNGDGLFYLLSLSTHQVKLYEGTRHSITKISIDDLVPGQIEDVVGYDYEQKNLQYRQQPSIQGQTIINGQGPANAKENSELKHFLNEVDYGITKLIHEDQRPPLILVCVENIYGIYKNVNSYRNLFPKHINESPTNLDDLLLHEKAWLLVEDYFGQDRRDKLNAFNQCYGTEKTSTKISNILPAALDGRIDTLFLENMADAFGVYDPVKRSTQIEENEKPPNVSLYNMVAIETIKNGGDVIMLEKEEFPEGFEGMMALFRF